MASCPRDPGAGLEGPGPPKGAGGPPTASLARGTGRLAAATAEDEMGGRRSEGEGPDVLPGAHRSGLQIAQLDAPRRDGRRRRPAAGLALTLLRAGGFSRGGHGRCRRRRGRLRRGRSAGAGPGGARALGGSRIHLIGDPLRVRREDRIGRVVHRQLDVGLQIQQVQDRLGLGRDGVGQLEDVGNPPAVSRDLPAGDLAPFGVIVDGHGLLGGGFRLRQRVGRRHRDRQDEGEDRDRAASECGSCGVHVRSFSDVIWEWGPSSTAPSMNA